MSVNLVPAAGVQGVNGRGSTGQAILFLNASSTLRTRSRSRPITPLPRISAQGFVDDTLLSLLQLSPQRPNFRK